MRIDIFSGVGILVSLVLLLVALNEILPSAHPTLPYIGKNARQLYINDKKC